MAKSSGKITGSDAAYIRPKLIPDYELLPRDDSGGPDFDPYTQEFGDGGFVQGQDEKHHLAATDDGQHAEEEDEPSHEPRARAALAAEPRSRKVQTPSPAASRAMSKK